MSKAIEKTRRWCAILVVVGIALGCSAKRPDEATATRQALSTTNGLWSNGLTTNGLWSNGLWSNGLWSNGLWSNGLWSNGLWSNGLWSNGLWSNGLWSNGLWSNGLWSNGLWSNGLWSNGLPGQAGTPADTLRSSPYARQLLQYVYSCAMPATTYDTTLDPNTGPLGDGSLPCSTPDAGADGGAQCDVGYECSSDGKCVVPLKGAIGLAINDDGTTWWRRPAPGGATDLSAGKWGQCDESCQRWVSACVLARTNAYGVHVAISMRAPATVPAGRERQFGAIQTALLVTSAESAFTHREGAYYGSLFATTPVSSTGVPSSPPAPIPPATTFTGPDPGHIASTPSFYACAGPESNTPEITKRFCSSQGDQSVINVPGVCVHPATDAGATEPAMCDGIDLTGSIHGCYTGPNGTGTHYDEVITVYLADPLAVCGNAVCEDGEQSETDPLCAPSVTTPCYCPSDCHPGTWVHDTHRPLFHVDQNRFFPSGIPGGGGAIAAPADNSIVVYGYSFFAADGSEYPNAAGFVAKFNADGTYAWGARLDDGLVADGAAVASNGNIVVIGNTTPAAPSYPAIAFSLFSPAGVRLGTGVLTPTSGSFDVIVPSPSVAFDSQDNLVFAAFFHGHLTFGPTLALDSPPITPSIGYVDDVVVAKVSLGAGNSGPLTPTVLWADDVGSSLDCWDCQPSGNGPVCEVKSDCYISPHDAGPLSLVVDSSDNIVVVSGGIASHGSSLTKLASDGTQVFTHTPVNAVYLSANEDSQGGIYATGVASKSSVDGVSPFLEKFDSAGSSQWTASASIVCPPGESTCGAPLATLNTLSLSEDFRTPNGIVAGQALGFDAAGNVVVGSFGNPVARGGIDFGVGTFPTYSRKNIFVSAYDSSTGQLRWAKQVPTILGSTLQNLTIDGQGRAVLTGTFSGSMQLDGRLAVTTVPEDEQVIDSFVASFPVPSLLDKTPPCIGSVDTCLSSSTTVPQNIYVQATSSGGAVVFFMPPTAIDAGHAGTSVVCSPAPNTTFAIGTTPVTCTASDPLGNHSSATFMVAVVDTLGPVFSPVADITMQATSASGATVPYAPPTAIDQVDGGRPVTCKPSPSSVFAVGATPVTCTSSDSRGNTSTVSFAVTVTPPPISVHCVGSPGSPVVVSMPQGTCGVSVSGASSIAGGCGGVGLLSCTFGGQPAEAIGPGDNVIPVVATGVGGSTTTCTSYVRVVDGEKPAISCQGVQAQCTGSGGAAATPTATCTDNCGCTSRCIAGFFPVGTSSGSCTATDTSGNGASCQPMITIVDTKPPVVTPRPGPSRLQCAVDAWSDPGATASDQCAGDLSSRVTVTGAVDPMHVGAYVASYSAADPSGNVGSASRAVSVVDTLAPVLTAVAGPNPASNKYINVNVTSYSIVPKGGGAAVSGSADCWTSPGISVSLGAKDACGLKQLTYGLTGAQTGGATVAGGSTSVTVSKVGSTTLSYTATDKAGNATTTQTLPIFVGLSCGGFGFSCAPATSFKGIPSCGTVTAKGTLTSTNPANGKKTTLPFSVSWSYCR